MKWFFLISKINLNSNFYNLFALEYTSISILVLVLVVSILLKATFCSVIHDNTGGKGG